MERISELKSQLLQPKDVVLLTHRNPDGDAIGSALAMYHFLGALGHAVKAICPSEYPDFLEWMPDINKMLVYDADPEKAKEAIEQAELIFCLDFNALDRIDKMGELVHHSKVPKVLIDHHLEPEPFADYLLSDTAASSTCELIFDFIGMLDMRQHLDATVADCIYTGIVTDTGSFKYATSPRVFRKVAELLELGVNDVLLQELIFNNLKEKHLRLLGYCLYHRLEVLPDFRTAIITLTKEDYAKFEIQRGDTEGIVNYLLRMPDIKVAAFITEQPTIVKISLRSKGDFSVQEIAQKHFKGGGHKNASGGASFIGLRPTVRKFKELLPLYQTQLQQQ